MKIVYASQTGTAAQLAFELKHDLRSITDIPVVDASALHFAALKQVVLFIVSTTGDGEPPLSLLSLWTTMLDKSLTADTCRGLNYAVFGLGDSGYRLFNAAARRLDKRLQQLGGHRLIPIGLGDDRDPNRYITEYAKWLQSLIPVLQGIKCQPSLRLIQSKRQIATIVAAKIISSRNKLTYQVLVRADNYRGQPIIAFFPKTTFQREGQYLSSRASRCFIKKALAKTEKGPQQKKLCQMLESNLFFDYAVKPRRHLGELISDFSALQSCQDIAVQSQPPVEPRYYSISNLPEKDGLVRLLVRQVREQITPYRTFKGHFSQLIEKVSSTKTEQTIEVQFVDKCEVGTNKMIAVCAGTGVAPVLRLVSKMDKSKVLVVRGASYSEQLYYRSQLEGVKLFQGCSRQLESVHVQDIMRKNEEALLAFWSSGVLIYVVMPNKTAADTVKDTLTLILGPDRIKESRMVVESW